MATTETLNVQLQGGGEISLIVETDWLAADLEDVCFIQRLAQLMRSYRSMPILVSPAVVPDSLRAAVKTAEPDVLIEMGDIEARRKADRERKKAERERNKTATPAARQANRPGASKYDYAEVARIANAATRAEMSMTAAVASKFSVSSAMGSHLIKEARKRGHDIDKSGRGAKPVTSNVTSIAKPVVTASHPAASRAAFTPDDSLKLLQGGIADG